MSKEVTIGIDLGTSNSCVATVIDGDPRVLANANGDQTTASVVAFHEDGSIVVGNRAKAEVILDPKHTVSSAKRLIGRYYFSEEVRKARAIYRYEIASGESHSVRIKIRDEEFSLPEISAFVLKEIKQIAEQQLGCEVSRAVITVPAYFNDNQRQATKDAGRIAGLEVMRILNEPTAAALAYGYGRDLSQRVAVYDLGGGTFDVSVLEIGEDVFEVLSTCGDTYLGGDDFDDRLIDQFAEKIQAEHSVNVRSDATAFEKLKEAAEKAKIDLSRADAVTVSIPDLVDKDGEQISFEHELTRREFDKLTRDLVHRTFKVCDEALQQAGVTTRDLEGIILVGGPTRLPTIREAVKEYFQREPEVDINPDEVVALGAAIHADSLASPSKDTFLLDVTPLTLRIGIAGGLTQPIIDRNSPIPIDHTRVFTPAQDHQKTVGVRVYQGEARSAEENALLAEFEFSDFQAGLRDEVKIDVTFAIDTEGIVCVTARDRTTGAEAQTTVSMSSGLSEEEIQEILERSRAEDVQSQEIHAASDEALDGGTLDEELLLDMPEVEASVQAALEAEEANDELFGAIDVDLAEGELDLSDLVDQGSDALEPPPKGEEDEITLADDDDELILGSDEEL
jgi:molecular chaperone DnaK